MSFPFSIWGLWLTIHFEYPHLKVVLAVLHKANGHYSRPHSCYYVAHEKWIKIIISGTRIGIGHFQCNMDGSGGVIMLPTVMFHNTHSIFADIIQAEIFEPNLSNSITDSLHVFAHFHTLPVILTFLRTFGPCSTCFPSTLFPNTSFNNSHSYCV